SPASWPARGSIDEEAAVDVDDLCGDVAGLRRAEEGGHPGNIVGGASTADGNLVDELRDALHHLGLDERRRESVGGYARSRVLDGNRLDQSHHPRLGRGVRGGRGRAARLPRARSDCDDAAIVTFAHGAEPATSD